MSTKRLVNLPLLDLCSGSDASLYPLWARLWFGLKPQTTMERGVEAHTATAGILDSSAEISPGVLEEQMLEAMRYAPVSHFKPALTDEEEMQLIPLRWLVPLAALKWEQSCF